MPPFDIFFHEYMRSHALYGAHVIVDPSIVLTRWGIFALDRLDRGPFQTPYIAPTLASLITHGTLDTQRDVSFGFQQEMGLDPRETKEALDLWSRRSAQADPTVQPRKPFTNIEEDGMQGPAGQQQPTPDLETYRKCLAWLNANLGGPSGPNAPRLRLEAPAEQIFMEQVALGVALSGRGSFVLARCASEPWFWRHLKKKGIVPCKEITEEEWLRDEIQEKKNWLRTRGIHQLVFAGFTFGFTHFVFPEPNLMKDSIMSLLSAGWALYTDP